MPGADWCEIKRSRDFLCYAAPADWIITNPPWSRIHEFLTHSFTLAADVAFLMTVNHAWMHYQRAWRGTIELHDMVACELP